MKAREAHGGCAEELVRVEQVRRPRLVAVKVAGAEAAADFRLSLANGRRIECSWRFADAELARLISIAESA